jgi:hypothetical protein
MTTIWRTRDFPSTAERERSPRRIEFKRGSLLLVGEELAVQYTIMFGFDVLSRLETGKETD